MKEGFGNIQKLAETPQLRGEPGRERLLLSVARPACARSIAGSLCSAAEWATFPAADVELIGAVRAALRGAAQPELARPMQAYMKSATPLAIGY